MSSLKDSAKRIVRKLRNKLSGVNSSRMIWEVGSVSDVAGPVDNVRNYIERQNLRSILKGLSAIHPLQSACEVGCGYGRIIMVLKEFSDQVVGFERETHLVALAQSLLPGIEFCRCDSLDQIGGMKKGPFDFVMTWTVLQHLTDDFCVKVIDQIKQLAPNGYVLLTEKNDAIRVTENNTDDSCFISRARPVELYQEWMRPFVLVQTTARIVEPGYPNPKPGTCLLFRSPAITVKQI